MGPRAAFARRNVNAPAAAALLLPSILLCVPAPAWGQGEGAPAAARDTSPFSVGVEFAQFVQGVASGGMENDAAYGGRLEVELKVDTRRLGLWKNGTLTVLAATRYGDAVTPFTGALIPANTALLDPGVDGTVTAVTALNYTQIVPFGKPGNEFVVALGRFSTLDLIPDGTGMTGHMNVGQIAPTTELVNVPPVTLGVTSELVLGGEPVLTLLVIDSESSALTSGLDGLFENGVTISPAVTIPTRFFGRAGHQGLRGTWSSRERTPFDQVPLLVLPDPDDTVTVNRESGSWSLTYTADQFIHQNPGPHPTGWRLLWNVSVADERTNPVGRYFNVGIAATSPFPGRPLDSFGLGWAYTGFSDDFKELLDPLVRIDDEQAIEAFYNVALAPWARLTADLQVIWPFRPGVSTAFVPGARLHFVF